MLPIFLKTSVCNPALLGRQGLRLICVCELLLPEVLLGEQRPRRTEPGHTSGSHVEPGSDLRTWGTRQVAPSSEPRLAALEGRGASNSHRFIASSLACQQQLQEHEPLPGASL